MGALFGTDGIRGKANEPPMTAEVAVKIGRAVASFFEEKGNKILLGKDTRISGDMLEYALASGICSMGADVYLAGIFPTPGVAFLVADTGASAGMVISASHNPFYDNGIKVFNEKGFKLSEETETEIEQLVLSDRIASLSLSVRQTGRVYPINDAEKRYISFLTKILPQECSLKKLKIVMDCSNGATYRFAPQLFSDLGAEVDALSVVPDGKNINQNCGSQHPEVLIQKVIENKADIGLAFDGDGDRLIAVDEKGAVLTGDAILAICAKKMKQAGTLKNNRVVSTVMSNLGLGKALREMGIEHLLSDVGDRHVMEKMLSSGAVLGGEDSGHLIFLDHHSNGDGILSALQLVLVVQEESKPLSELAKIMTVFPQFLINVPVKRKPDIHTVPDIQEAIRSVETCLGEKGRVLVRYSGTEPLCRIMIEGPSQEETRRYCHRIADVVKEKIGT